jgi:mono/diheme cytochrome c family protein
MKSRLTYGLPTFAFLVMVAAYVFAPALTMSRADAARVVPIDSSKKGAMIKIDEDVYDFHDIEQGTIAEHGFTIKNVGTDTLVILSTHPSCGCTAAMMQGGGSRIAPGQSNVLQVKFDANNKPEGPIQKSVTISSNSRERSETMIRIQGRVVKSKLAHKSTMHLDGLFQGDCAKCHVDKGRGELGARLYEADCAICHGTKQDMKPGAELAAASMMNHTPKQWKQIIENGIPNTGMPAFHTKNKGPLGDEEIASLVEYMGAFKKELQRAKAMSNAGDGKSSDAKPSEVKTAVIKSTKN